MLWKDREGSSNVEDRRGEGGGFGGGSDANKLILPAERPRAGIGEVFFCGTENNGRNMGQNFCSVR